MNPEVELLLRLESREFRPSPSLDWARLLVLASQHGLSSILAARLLEFHAASIPGVYAAQFSQSLKSSAVRNLGLTAELFRILDLFRDRGIRAVPFKGPSMTAALYGNLALRESVDLDILVRPADASRATGLLTAAGYNTDLPADPAVKAAYLRTRHEIHFTTQGGNGLVELHTAFTAPCYRIPFDYDSLWERLDTMDLCGRRIPALSAHDLLIGLAIHGARHCWNRLIWILDVARLLAVNRATLDWTELERHARLLGAVRLLNVALALAADLFEGPLPDEILARVRADSGACALAAEVRKTLFLDDVPEPGELAQHLFFLRARERAQHRLGHLRSLAFTPTDVDYAFVRLPGALEFLYYPIHLARVSAGLVLPRKRTAA